MKITLVSFGIAKDIIGSREMEYELPDSASVGNLLEKLAHDYPDFKDLASIRVAVNTEYAKNDQVISPQDEVVLIPPVSGG